MARSRGAHGEVALTGEASRRSDLARLSSAIADLDGVIAVDTSGVAWQADDIAPPPFAYM